MCETRLQRSPANVDGNSTVCVPLKARQFAARPRAFCLQVWSRGVAPGWTGVDMLEGVPRIDADPTIGAVGS